MIVWSFVFSAFAFDNVSILSANFFAAGGCDTPVSGPWSGGLEHTEDETIANYSTGIFVENFIAEAEFYNPYSTSEGKWDYGFLFRLAKGDYYAIQIAYGGTWRHILFTEGKWYICGEGNVSLRTGANQSNHVRIIVIGNSGALYVNGKFINTLDTSELTQKGDVRAATGINYEFKIPGEVTQCNNFTVWSLDIPTSGPLSEDLEDKKDGSIEAFSASVNIKDFIAEAVFDNPYSPSEGKWDYGFLFRKVTENTSYAICVTSESTWRFAVKFGRNWRIIKEGTIFMPTRANQSNILRIIVIGNSGWFFVNNQFITALDTSGLTQSGDVMAATGIIFENELESKVTRFENFAVWSLDGCPELPVHMPNDKDNDGVINDEDECDNPGCTIVDENGCPKDSDSDGVIDCSDDCPYQKGPASADGCPSDRDKDGVIDDVDKCDNPGCTIVDENGCPTDSDSDGFFDCVDECPTEYAKPTYNGCPDTDNDGVIDGEDDCNNPDCDIVDSKGCPIDSDSDGVPDCDDECPLEYGEMKNKGCPSPIPILPLLLVFLISSVSITIYKRKYIKSRLFPTGFERIHPNPYVAGTPIRDQSIFFERKDVFQFIKDKFSATKNIAIVLHGERRTGKTSVLYQIENGNLGKNFVPVYIDLQEMAKVNEKEFFTKLSSKIMESLIKLKIITLKSSDHTEIKKIIKQYKSESNPYTIFTDFLDKVSSILKEEYLIVMVDEYEILEKKIKSGHLSPDLIQYMRNLIQNRERFSFIFAGSKKLEELEGIHWSFMFNLATYKKISFLKKEDALDLMRIPVGDKIQYTDNVVDKLLRLTACHPYFLQLILQNLVDHLNEIQENCVSPEEITHVLQYIVDNPSPHMFYIWKDSTYNQKMVLSALAEIIEFENQYIPIKKVYEKLLENGAILDETIIKKALIDMTKKEILGHKKGEAAYNFKVDILRYWIENEYPLFRVTEDTE